MLLAVFCSFDRHVLLLENGTLSLSEIVHEKRLQPTTARRFGGFIPITVPGPSHLLLITIWGGWSNKCILYDPNIFIVAVLSLGCACCRYWFSETLVTSSSNHPLTRRKTIASQDFSGTL